MLWTKQADDMLANSIKRNSYVFKNSPGCQPKAGCIPIEGLLVVVASDEDDGVQSLEFEVTPAMTELPNRINHLNHRNAFR